MHRKMMAVLIVACLAALVSFAGEKQGKLDAASHAAKLKAELSLTDEQTAQVESVFAGILERMQPIRASMRATHQELKALRNATVTDAGAIEAKETELEAIRAQKRELKAERDNAMQQILTSEQLAKYQEIVAAHSKKKMGAGHKGQGHQK